MTKKQREELSEILGGMWAISCSQDRMVSNACADLAEKLGILLTEDDENDMEI